tara:strand:- start:16091 stop:17305 length:1215 start_codon:yes stop_codon:yes gene_type:complete
MKKILLTTMFVLSMILLIYACSSDDDMWDSIIPETAENPTQDHTTTNVFQPAIVAATAERVNQLQLPEGFSIHKFAEDLGEARIIEISEAGRIYVSLREEGQVLLLEDTNGDGTADRRETVATLENAHGLKIHDNKLYIVTIKEIYAADMHTDGTLSEPQLLYSGLPDGGQHPNRTIGFGPDGMMYITVGSTCNACVEPNEFNGTMLRANADASDMQVFAEGLRNTIGFGWNPDTGVLWGMDHGIDMLGDEEQSEELNQIQEGAHYGWPHIYDDGQYNPNPRPEDMTYAEFAAMSTFPELLYTAHAAPMEMEFYTGNQFPEAYQGDAFVAFRGSWNRRNPMGYKVCRIMFENGSPVRIEDFLTGFLVDENTAHFGRLVGLAVHPDGSLFLTDDTNGVMYQIKYE